MKAVQIGAPGGPFEIVERELPSPRPGWVRLKVHACGVCHSDSFVKEGHWPGLQYPRITGHEVAGVIDALGENVTNWKVGQRVGVGWYGGHCGICPPCRRGDFALCRIGGVTGFTHDGGYAEYMTAPAQALASLPDELSPNDAAPLLCAGITTFNSLRHSGARPGDVVAIIGIGGLGHLGIQFANRFGYHTVAIARGADKEPLARQLGAHRYLDSAAVNAAEELQKLGGANVILATAPSAQSMTELIPGLAPNGKMMVVGATADPIQVPPFALIGGRTSIQGWPSGTAADSEDTLRFSALTGVRPMIETYPLERAAEAYDRMMSAAARFRVVLQIAS